MSPLVSLSKRCVDLHTAENISSCIAGTAGSTACVETYEHALADFGPSARLPIKSGALACRRESLGNSLCEHAWRLLPGTSSKIRSEAQNIYATWMRQLQGHETKPRDCARFYQFHRLKWQPQVFFWAEGTLPWYEPLVGYLQADPLYQTTWRFAAEKLYYGPRDVNVVNAKGKPVIRMEAGAYRLKRFEEVEHQRVLWHGSRVNVSSIMQIIEFGGGGGETSATMRDLGFRGVHLVYDLPQMLLMQRYFLRDAAVPAYLVGVDVPMEHVRSIATHGRTPRSLMVSSVHNQLPSVLRSTTVPMLNTLVIAIASFTEAGVPARNTFRPNIRGAGCMLIGFWDQAFKVNNNAYLLDMLNQDFGGFQYSICVWRRKISDPGRRFYYLLAVHRSLGVASCSSQVGCSADSLHTNFLEKVTDAANTCASPA